MAWTTDSREGIECQPIKTKQKARGMRLFTTKIGLEKGKEDEAGI